MSDVSFRYYACLIQNTNENLVKRYGALIRKALTTHTYTEKEKTELYRVLDMCKYIQTLPGLDAGNDILYVDKWSRWLGYIQRVLVEFKLTTVDDERVYTRKKFHKVYKDVGLPKPPTITLMVQPDFFLNE